MFNRAAILDDFRCIGQLAVADQGSYTDLTIQAKCGLSQPEA